MIAVFEVWYDDRNPVDRRQARVGAEDVKALLSRSGIVAELEDDPPVLDRRGRYELGPVGRIWVIVSDAEAVRSRELIESPELV